MKVFICSRSIDSTYTTKIIDELLLVSENTLVAFQEAVHNDTWKKSVEEKLIKVDFVVFLIGNETFNSEQIKWEYEKAKSLNKYIVGIKILPESSKSIIYYQGYNVFDSPLQCYNFLKNIYEEQKKLKLEQYKMMVGSTEKVTDQRLKVNNLFFTVTSTLLSIGFVIVKTFNFSKPSFLILILITIMAFLVTFFWEKLITSYGLLNTGKFIIIDKIEKDLQTNMFADEWQILTNEIKYKPNSLTEKLIIKRFRIFILLLIIGETIFIYNT